MEREKKAMEGLQRNIAPPTLSLSSQRMDFTFGLNFVVAEGKKRTVDYTSSAAAASAALWPRLGLGQVVRQGEGGG